MNKIQVPKTTRKKSEPDEFVADVARAMLKDDEHA